MSVTPQDWWRLRVFLRGGQQTEVWVDTFQLAERYAEQLLDKAAHDPVVIRGLVATPLIVSRVIHVHPDLVAAVDYQLDSVLQYQVLQLPPE